MSMMRNNLFYGALSWRQAKPVLLHPKLFQGFRDYQAGRPFDYRTLDGWPLLDQHRYENGRELAAECRAAGIMVVWIDRTRIPRPLKALVVGRAMARHPPTCRRTGLSCDTSAGDRRGRQPAASPASPNACQPPSTLSVVPVM